MSIKEMYVVARVGNHQDKLVVRSDDARGLARYIEDNNILSKLFGVDCGGLRLISVGMNGSEMCVLMGATVPEGHKVEYGELVKVLDKSLFEDDKSMFWSYNATYILTENYEQLKWWMEVVKEMDQSYTIEGSSIATNGN